MGTGSTFTGFSKLPIPNPFKYSFQNQKNKTFRRQPSKSKKQMEVATNSNNLSFLDSSTSVAWLAFFNLFSMIRLSLLQEFFAKPHKDRR